jgi:hypothetical protein
MNLDPTLNDDLHQNIWDRLLERVELEITLFAIQLASIKRESDYSLEKKMKRKKGRQLRNLVLLELCASLFPVQG